jgi:hypothetical protein
MFYTLFGSPRTGSTLVYFIVRWYLIKKYNYRDVHLGEFFNPYHYNLLYRDVYVNGEKSYKENIPQNMQHNAFLVEAKGNTLKAPPHKEVFTLDNTGIVAKIYDYENLKPCIETEETTKRINLLQTDKEGLYFFKNHANPLPKLAFNYLLQNCFFICLKRKEKIQQYLSFAVANATRVWMQRANAPDQILQPDSLVYTREMFDTLTSRIQTYYDRLQEIPSNRKIELIYEDINRLNDKFEILDLLGFTDWKDYLDPVLLKPRLPAKQAKVDSLIYFKNRNELLSWIEEIKY